jgi:hypothetical protein
LYRLTRCRADPEKNSNGHAKHNGENGKSNGHSNGKEENGGKLVDVEFDFTKLSSEGMMEC